MSFAAEALVVLVSVVSVWLIWIVTLDIVVTIEAAVGGAEMSRASLYILATLKYSSVVMMCISLALTLANNNLLYFNVLEWTCAANSVFVPITVCIRFYVLQRSIRNLNRMRDLSAVVDRTGTRISTHRGFLRFTLCVCIVSAAVLANQSQSAYSRTNELICPHTIRGYDLYLAVNSAVFLSICALGLWHSRRDFRICDDVKFMLGMHDDVVSFINGHAAEATRKKKRKQNNTRVHVAHAPASPSSPYPSGSGSRSGPRSGSCLVSGSGPGSGSDSGLLSGFNCDPGSSPGSDPDSGSGLPRVNSLTIQTSGSLPDSDKLPGHITRTDHNVISLVNFHRPMQLQSLPESPRSPVS